MCDLGERVIFVMSGSRQRTNGIGLRRADAGKVSRRISRRLIVRRCSSRGLLKFRILDMGNAPTRRTTACTPTSSSTTRSKRHSRARDRQLEIAVEEPLKELKKGRQFSGGQVKKLKQMCL